jgi:hypothetical protein
VAFLYDQDMKMMVQNAQAFDAFICALTALLAHAGQTDARPPGFPRQEGWVQVPVPDIDWSFLGLSD